MEKRDLEIFGNTGTDIIDIDRYIYQYNILSQIIFVGSDTGIFAACSGYMGSVRVGGSGCDSDDL